MPKISKSVKIDAPLEKVFDFVTSPDNWTHYVAGLTAVKDRSAGLPKLGGTFRWEYKLLGFAFTGKGEVTNYSRNRTFGMKLSGQMTIDEHYEFKSGGDGTTTLDITVDYVMPGKVSEYFGNSKLASKLYGIESKHILENIKAICESR